MKTLVIYDSLYGNTAQVAKAVGSAVAGEARVLSVNEANPSELGAFDLLIVACPTQGGRPTDAMRDFLGDVPSLGRARVAVFDTRLRAKWVRVFGYAAGKLGDKVKAIGATLVAEPEGFIVEGKEGPLVDGELERAALWAKSIAA